MVSVKLSVWSEEGGAIKLLIVMKIMPAAMVPLPDNMRVSTLL